MKLRKIRIGDISRELFEKVKSLCFSLISTLFLSLYLEETSCFTFNNQGSSRNLSQRKKDFSVVDIINEYQLLGSMLLRSVLLSSSSTVTVSSTETSSWTMS